MTGTSIATGPLHMFDDETRHRGQVHALPTGLVREGPVLDLLAFQRESGIGMA